MSSELVLAGLKREEGEEADNSRARESWAEACIIFLSKNVIDVAEKVSFEILSR